MGPSTVATDWSTGHVSSSQPSQILRLVTNRNEGKRLMHCTLENETSIHYRLHTKLGKDKKYLTHSSETTLSIRIFFPDLLML